MFKYQDLQMLGLVSNFHSLEVVGRGSDAQLQVSENLNYLTRKALQESSCTVRFSRFHPQSVYLLPVRLPSRCKLAGLLFTVPTENWKANRYTPQ